MIDLSVIVPVYNMAGDGKLNYSMDSLVNQTLKNMEIIAVDDKSTDNSLDILKDYEKRYPGRVRVIASPENRRQGGAKNLGLKEAGGRFIGFMDSDDWMKEDAYEKMFNLAMETGADAVGVDMSLVSEHTMTPGVKAECNNSGQTGILDHETRERFLLKPGPLVTKIYAREVFFDRPFAFPEHISYEDNATMTDIVMRIKHFEFIPEADYFYYQHGSSTTHSITKKKCEERMEAMRIMYTHSKENGALTEYRDAIEYQFANMFYRNTLFTYMQGNMKKEISFAENLGREMTDLFPDFRNNPYYIKEVNKYERDLIDLQLKNTGWFFFIYKLKQISKKLKGK